VAEAAALGCYNRPVAGNQEGDMAALWFEDFEVDKVHRHPITRTVTEMDNMMFSCLTMNPQPLHIDRHFCAETEWGQPLMNSLFTLGLMIGISVNDLTVGTTIANLGMSEVKFPAPLFQGDTVRVETTVKASAKAVRGQMPESSSSSTAPTSTTARWSPSAPARRSCASGPAGA
jgi:acyl dehydratase